jgi:restriction endonuclease S subunit
MENVTSKNNLDKHELQLPNSWVKFSLEAVCEILDSRRIPINASERANRTSGKSRKELFPYFGATGQVGYIDDYIFEGEYVLLGEDGAPFLDSFKDKAYIASGKFWVNNHAHILRSKVSNKFLCHYLNQFNYAEYVTGTTRLKLNQSSLLNIPIVFPPENEQHRIVAKIEELFSELDKGVESLKVAREQLKVYRQALLKHAFEGKLTEQWRKAHADQLETADQLLERINQERERRYQQQLADWEAAGKSFGKPKAPKSLLPFTAEEVAELPELPEGWCWLKLSNLSESIQIGPFGSLLHKSDYIENGIPLINPSHIKNQLIEPDLSLSITQEKLSTLSNYVMQIGDIIMGRRGEMGRCAVISEHENGFLCGTGSLFIRLLPSLIPGFYCHILSSRRIKDFLSDQSIGTTMQNLNQEILHSVPIPLCTVFEQEKIIEELDRKSTLISEVERTIEFNFQKIEVLRQSILKKAFSGQLVPQDLNDEPASILLEHIRTEREQQKPKFTKSPSRRSGTKRLIKPKSEFDQQLKSLPQPNVPIVPSRQLSKEEIDTQKSANRWDESESESQSDNQLPLPLT